MGLASYCFTKNVDRMWRLFENLEAGMIGMNSGKSATLVPPPLPPFTTKCFPFQKPTGQVFI